MTRPRAGQRNSGCAPEPTFSVACGSSSARPEPAAALARRGGAGAAAAGRSRVGDGAGAAAAFPACAVWAPGRRTAFCATASGFAAAAGWGFAAASRGFAGAARLGLGEPAFACGRDRRCMAGFAGTAATIFAGTAASFAGRSGRRGSGFRRFRDLVRGRGSGGGLGRFGHLAAIDGDHQTAARRDLGGAGKAIDPHEHIRRNAVAIGDDLGRFSFGEGDGRAALRGPMIVTARAWRGARGGARRRERLRLDGSRSVRPRIEPVLTLSIGRPERDATFVCDPKGSEKGSEAKRLASEQPEIEAAAPAARASRSATLREN